MRSPLSACDDWPKLEWAWMWQVVDRVIKLANYRIWKHSNGPNWLMGRCKGQVGSQEKGCSGQLVHPSLSIQELNTCALSKSESHWVQLSELQWLKLNTVLWTWAGVWKCQEVNCWLSVWFTGWLTGRQVLRRCHRTNKRSHISKSMKRRLKVVSEIGDGVGERQLECILHCTLGQGGQYGF